ncbi:MAG: heat-inducible transcriptional repressor HrcA [Candidatus Kapaibacterium sp.]|nr:MAG: heat-inducible transcriptional repressor HrcA [Candidatus Kapabacteria bacterium]
MKTVLPSQSINTQPLSAREHSVLQAIVQNFILDATPVGSRNLSKCLQEDLHLSPATLRNTMADLEELGYIAQPHTSAGRIPTDKGYRYYVDSLAEIGLAQTGLAQTLAPMGIHRIEPLAALSSQEMDAIQQNITAAKQQESSLRDVSKVLGALSRHLAVVRMPQIANAIVQRMELFQLASRRLLVVLTLNSDIVRTLTLEADFELESHDCENLARALNERIAGKSLRFIREHLQNLVRETELGEYALEHTIEHAMMRLFVDSAEELFTDHVLPNTSTLHIAGAQHLFDHPEFGSASRVRGIIELMEHEEIIVHLLEQTAPLEGHVRVAIGSELSTALAPTQMEDYSLLTTKYRFASANAIGTIGLIGPKRMNYSRMMAIMHVVADALSQEG